MLQYVGKPKYWSCLMLLKQNQQKTCSLCGHRILYSAMKIEKRLFQEIENLIKDGCSIFKIGTHGAFDQLALSVCRQLKTQYPHIKIQVVFTAECFCKR